MAMHEHGIARAVKLASNELAFGPLPAVAKAIDHALGRVNRYPDHGAVALRQALAERLGVAPDRVAVGSGSVGLLQQLCLAYVEPGDEVAFGWPSFEAYPIDAQLVGATEVRMPLRRQTISASGLAARLTERTRLVLVANPNNPTGTAVRAAELAALADALPARCLLVVDEAYREFVTGADVPDALSLLGHRPNVAVLRTFSKAHGLAGLRVGYLVGAPEVVAAVDKVLIPFSVSGVGQAAAMESLAAEAELAERVAVVVGERARVAGAVRRLGYPVPDPQANFVWLPVGEASVGLALALERAGVVTRPFAGAGVRVTIGTPEENDAFLAALGAGPCSTPAQEWLDRLDAVEQRLVAHASRSGPGLTGADPATGEQWDGGQVWAHLAEFGRYWLAELDTVVDTPGAEPVPFGRVKTDAARVAAIEAGRGQPVASHLHAVRGAIDALRARLAELDEGDWRRVGRHSTLGDMDVPAQLQHFHVGHYEEHADQLDDVFGAGGRL
jgi:histidinol-phosphate aminotransferase